MSNTHSVREVTYKKEPIAIVGLGVRLPGDADDPSKLWDMLAQKTDAICDIPPDRWDAQSFYDPDYNRSSKMNVLQGGFIKDIDKFDAGFFGISPKEALRVDPQHRLLLEASYKAFEDAGIDIYSRSGTKTGVFVGISSHDYGDIQNFPSERVTIGPHTATGGAQSIAANRISYLFNLNGPSFIVDTACSSSLLAIHHACRSIWLGEAEMALAGGVNAIIRPEVEMGFSAGGFLSPDARSKAFDSRANGYIRSEGCGVILLKPLSQAQKDGDKIYACILGTATNQDGKTNGIAFPNPEAQKKVMEAAYADAGIHPAQVNYVEMHGTGTAAGDPIECESVGSTIGANKKNGDTLIIGSIKTNVGHLEPASGAAGISKLALILKNRKILPNIHFQTPNPKIKWSEYNLKVVTEITQLPEGTIYAGINSFGFGGTNVHAVLMSPPENNTNISGNSSGTSASVTSASAQSAASQSVTPQAGAENNEPHLFVLSAKSETALKQFAGNFITFLESPLSETMSLRDICYTAGAKRSHHDQRLSITAHSKNELAQFLRAWLGGESRIGMASGRVSDSPHKTAFVFSGQGPQWFAMGRELLEKEPVFRDCIEQIDKIFSKYASWSIKEELLRDEKSSRINETVVAQPAIFAVQTAIAQLWKSLGINPDGIVGHSIGEVAAGYCSGSVSLEDAVQVVYHRSRVQDKASGKGKMLAVGITEEQAKEEIIKFGGKVSIATINGPELVTISGDSDIIDTIESDFETRGIFNRIVRVNVPFHSHHMDPLKEELESALSGITPSNSSTALYSTVTGDLQSGPVLTNKYWFRNVREPVYFTKAISAMVRDGFDTFIEISPHPILSAGIGDMLKMLKAQGKITHSLRRKEEEKVTILGSLGTLYGWGVKLSWSALFGSNCNFVTIPGYPWQKERYWLESAQCETIRLGKKIHPLLAGYTQSPKEKDDFIWNIVLDKRTDRYIEDHRVQGPVVFPGAGHVELGLSAGLASFNEKFNFLEDINFKSALFLPDDGDPYDVQIAVSGAEGSYEISTRPKGSTGQWNLCSTGKMNHLSDSFIHQPLDISTARNRCVTPVNTDDLVEDLYASGLHLGPSFRGIKKLLSGNSESYGEVHVHESIQTDFDRYNLHPAVLDACFQVLFGSWYKGKDHPDKMGVYIPVHIDRVKFYAKPGGKVLRSYGKLTAHSDQFAKGNLWLYNERDELIAEIQGFLCQYLKGSRGENARNRDNWFYEYQWIMKARPEVEKFRTPGEYLAAPETLSETLLKEGIRMSRLPIQTQYLTVFEPHLDKLCISYIAEACEKLGLDFSAGTQITAGELETKFGVVPEHRRLFFHMLHQLEKHKILSRAADDKVNESIVTGDTGLTVLRRCAYPKGGQYMERLKKEYPAFIKELILLERCGPYIAEVITGKTDPIELIFPEREWDAIVDYYVSGYSFKKYNDLVQKALRLVLKKLPPERTLRVLEIGAGTGGMTQAVLPLLPADRTEYVYTDMSPMFLMKAQRRFSRYGFVQYQILDIEKDLAGQGIEPNSFDLIIASDVLHATRRLSVTLSHVREALASEGLLCMLEVTCTPLYLDLIFGMTEGWWLYEDTEIRPAHATMPLKKWQSVLKDNGFPRILGITDAKKTTESSQTVFLARRDKITDTGAEKVSAQAAEKGTWLVFTESKTGPKAAAHIQARGDRTIMVSAGNTFSKISDTAYQIRPGEEDDMHALISSAASGDTRIKGVLHLWAMDNPPTNKTTAAVLENAQLTHNGVLLNILRALVKADLSVQPQVWFVTAGAEYVDSNDNDIAVSQTSLWGLVRVMINEHPSIPTIIADLSLTPTDDEVQALVADFYSEGRKEEIAFRGRKRFMRRLTRLTPEITAQKAAKALPADNSSYHLELHEAGNLDNLCLRETVRPDELESDEVEIRVMSAALNFRDVMIAMGFLSDEAILGGLYGRTYGLESSGIVVRKGKNVKSFKVGDEVIGFTRDSIAGFARALSCELVKKPKSMSWAEGASIPIVYLTAYYSLHHQCRIAAGEWILIHAGAGGVGIAAINLAKVAGAQIIASASATKWPALKKMGVKHIVNSRSLSFADDVMKITGGRGVDIVLNSFSGKFIYQSVACLAAYGRFVEIGKTDIYRNSRIGLKPFGNNLSYFAVDVDRLLKEKPALCGELFKAVTDMYVKNKFIPHPVEIFPVSRTTEAFRYLAGAKNTGKVIISMKNETAAVQPSMDAASLIKNNATYLITGGLGGFGLSVAEWLAAKGAKYLALMGRSGAARPEAKEALARFKKAGVKVAVLKADVSDPKAVEKCFAQLKKTMPAVRGVFHAAMVLDDTVMLQITHERLMNVMRPKMTGAWNLHSATLKSELDLFVLFSSISSVYGNPGQGNYSAANSFLDAFSNYRHAHNLPSITINWGILGEVGFVARTEKVGSMLSSQGWKTFNLKESLWVLEKMLLEAPRGRVAIDADWKEVGKFFPHAASSVRFAHLIHEKEHGAAGGGGGGGSLKAALAGLSGDERRALLEVQLKETLARVLGAAPADIDPQDPITKMGLDSLMANQLRNWIQSNTDIEVSMMEIMKGPNIPDLAGKLLESISVDPEAATSDTPAAAGGEK